MHNDVEPIILPTSLAQPPTRLPRVQKDPLTFHIPNRHPPLHSKESYLQRYNLQSKTQTSPTTGSHRARAARYLLDRHPASKISMHELVASPHISHIFNDKGKKETVDSLLNGPDKDIWTCSMSNELGRLAQANIHGIKATNTIDSVAKADVPANKKVTYANFACDYRPLQSQNHHIHLVVRGDKLSYDDNSGSPVASLLKTKVLVNSVISDANKGTHFMSCDLKDFFLDTPMKQPEYMRIHW